MMDNQPWHFLVNPAAARGKSEVRWKKMFPQLKDAIPAMSYEFSTPERGLSQLAKEAIALGYRHIVGVGGDGTHHEIINGLVAAGLPEDLVYLPLPSGSGNDWVRTLGVPRKLEKWLAFLPNATTIDHSVGKLEFRSMPTADSLDSVKYFINVAGMAYDAEVVRRAEKSPFKRRLLYPLLTLAFLGDYSAPTVRIEWEGGQRSLPVHTINLGLGRFSGGGMSLVPHADPARGDFALTFAHRLPIWKILVHSWRFYTDTIGQVPEVTTAFTRTLTASPEAGQLELEADGEWLGYGPVKAEILGSKLRVVVPQN